MPSGIYKRSKLLSKKMSLITSKRMIGNKYRIGKNPWNKGKSGVQKISEETRKKLSLVKIGNKNRVGKTPWNKGMGNNSENKRIRESIEYKIWRKSVWERDLFTCQKCKNVGDKLHSHHIKNFSKYPELRFAINNGITFCEKCHKEFHKIYKLNNNSGIQLIEFLYGICMYNSN